MAVLNTTVFKILRGNTTQKQLADNIGISLRTLSTAEQGKPISSITFNKIINYFEANNCDTSKLWDSHPLERRAINFGRISTENISEEYDSTSQNDYDYFIKSAKYISPNDHSIMDFAFAMKSKYKKTYFNRVIVEKENLSDLEKILKHFHEIISSISSSHSNLNTLVQDLSVEAKIGDIISKLREFGIKIFLGAQNLEMESDYYAPLIFLVDASIDFVDFSVYEIHPKHWPFDSKMQLTLTEDKSTGLKKILNTDVYSYIQECLELGTEEYPNETDTENEWCNMWFKLASITGDLLP